MANIFDKVKDLLKVDSDDERDYDDYYDDEIYDDMDDYEDQPVAKSSPSYSTQQTPQYSNNISNFQRGSVHSSERVKIIIHEPIVFEDAPKVVDDILSNHVAVLNLEMLENKEKRQIFDFISGAIYALDGKIQKVTADIFVIAPKNIEIDGKIKDQIQAKGFYNI